MDISTVVVVVALIALFLGAIIWMEFHSRKNSPKGTLKDGKNPESNEMDLEQYSPFFPLRPNGTTSSKTRAEERKS